MDDDSKIDTNTRDPIIEYQLKYCSNILTRLKRNHNAGPFLQPVDPIALGIPDYFDKIKKPMDISTIKKKLDNNIYLTPEEFNNDMILMFNNCYEYNSPDSVVYEMGKNLQKAYEVLYSDLPENVAKKNKISAPVSPKITEKPKRAIRNIIATAGMSAEDYSTCNDILNEIEKPKYSKFTWPFLEPVSESEVPGYYDVIKKPMDLSTIRKKLENRSYSSVSEFVADLELIVENCYKFNSPDTKVYECCVEFEKLVNEKAGNYCDIEKRINEIRKQISQLTSELRILETKKSRNSKVFSLGDRERIGEIIIGMNKVQTEKIAEIVQRHCAYEYIDNDEIELNMHTIPDNVLVEINEYIQNMNNDTASKDS